MFLNIAMHGDKTMTFQFTGIAPEPHRNRKSVQFNNAHDCKPV